MGKIVNVSSISGTYGSVNEFAYSSAKSNIIYSPGLLQIMQRFNINGLSPLWYYISKIS